MCTFYESYPLAKRAHDDVTTFSLLTKNLKRSSFSEAVKKLRSYEILPLELLILINFPHHHLETPEAKENEFNQDLREPNTISEREKEIAEFILWAFIFRHSQGESRTSNIEITDTLLNLGPRDFLSYILPSVRQYPCYGEAEIAIFAKSIVEVPCTDALAPRQYWIQAKSFNQWQKKRCKRTGAAKRGRPPEFPPSKDKALVKEWKDSKLTAKRFAEQRSKNGIGVDLF